MPSESTGMKISHAISHGNFLFVFDTKGTPHDIIFLIMHIQARGTIITTILESHDLSDYFLFHLFLVCHDRFLPQQGGGGGGGRLRVRLIACGLGGTFFTYM